jgi:hypothetical protein
VRRRNQREETGRKRKRDRSGDEKLDEPHGRTRRIAVTRAPW